MSAALPFELDLSDCVLSKAVERWAQREPGRICIVQDDGASVSYAQLDQRASAIAAGLAALGVQAGDRVAVLMGNDLRTVYLTIALAKLGAIEVPVNPSLIGDSLRHILADAGPKIVVTDPQRRELLESALPQQRPVVVESIGEARAGTPTLDAMLSAPAEIVTTASVGLQPASIMYTSGTTGLPKGALLSHRYTIRICERAARLLEMTRDDTLLTILPQFHAGGKYMNVGACLLTGARCYLVRQFSASNFWKQACDSDATVAHALVSIGHFLIAQPPSEQERAHRITRALVVPAAQPVPKIFRERFGIRIFPGYASTECNIPVLNDPTREMPDGACGRVVPPYRVRIVDEHDRALPPRQTGEIVVSCDEPWSVFSGYWNQPEASLETLRNFGLHTGDAGYMDEDGYLYFVDRIKDVIRRRGENISSQTVEVAINAIDGVVESAAYAVPSEYGEDEIAVAIVGKPGATLTADSVAAVCREKLPRFAIPRYLRFVDALPKTETGKIQKFKLKHEGVGDAEVVENPRDAAKRR